MSAKGTESGQDAALRELEALGSSPARVEPDLLAEPEGFDRELTPTRSWTWPWPTGRSNSKHTLMPPTAAPD